MLMTTERFSRVCKVKVLKEGTGTGNLSDITGEAVPPLIPFLSCLSTDLCVRLGLNGRHQS